MPKIYGQLERAQVEVLSSNPSALVGRIWWNSTDGRGYLSDGTNNNQVLLNDGNIIVGTNGTANNNVRVHRGADSLLQAVLGGDSTSEGTLSTALAQWDAKVGNFTTGTRPAAGNAGRLIWNSTDSEFQGDNGAGWISLASSTTSTPLLLENVGLDGSVAASALTVALKQSDGSTDPSGGSPANIALRSATLTNGGYNVRAVTAALSVVVPSGATLGHPDGEDAPIYVYALDNAGTVELAVSASYFDDDDVKSTTAISAGADSRGVLYSTTARSNVPIRLLGKFISNQTTAGTWAAAPTRESVGFVKREKIAALYRVSNSTANTSIAGSSTEVIDWDTKISDTHDAVATGASWAFTAPKTALYWVAVKIGGAGTTGQVNSRWTASAYVDASEVRWLGSFKWQVTSSIAPEVNGAALIPLVAGEQLDVRVTTTNSNATTVDQTTERSHISITEV